MSFCATSDLFRQPSPWWTSFRYCKISSADEVFPELLHVYVNPIEVIRFCDMHASFCAPSNLASGSRCRKNRHGHCSFLKYTSKLIRAILEVNKMKHTGAFIVQVANGAAGEASLPWTRLRGSGLLLNIDTLKVASGHG